MTDHDLQAIAQATGTDPRVIRAFVAVLRPVVAEEIRRETRTIMERLGDATLSKKEAAERLAVSTKTFGRYEDRGLVTRLPGPGRPRYDARAVDALRDRRTL